MVKPIAVCVVHIVFFSAKICFDCADPYPYNHIEFPQNFFVENMKNIWYKRKSEKSKSCITLWNIRLNNAHKLNSMIYYYVIDAQSRKVTKTEKYIIIILFKSIKKTKSINPFSCQQNFPELNQLQPFNLNTQKFSVPNAIRDIKRNALKTYMSDESLLLVHKSIIYNTAQQRIILITKHQSWLSKLECVVDIFVVQSWPETNDSDIGS